MQFCSNPHQPIHKIEKYREREWEMSPYEYGSFKSVDVKYITNLKNKGYQISDSLCKINSLSFSGAHIPGSIHLNEFLKNHHLNLLYEINKYINKYIKVKSCIDNKSYINYDILDKIPLLNELLETNNHISELSISIIYPNTFIGPFIDCSNNNLRSYHSLTNVEDCGFLLGNPRNVVYYDLLDGYEYVAGNWPLNESLICDNSLPRFEWNFSDQPQIKIITDFFLFV